MKSPSDMNKGRFTKKNAAIMGKRGGKKTLRRYGKAHYAGLRAKSLLTH